MSLRIEARENPREAAEACGAAILADIEDARDARGSATLAVSGGSTPRIMFEWMARQGFDWTRLDLFWVDERCVPPENDQSNFRMTRESLLDSVGLAPDHIHRIRGELPPGEAVRLYIDDIERTFRLQPGELPVFDVIQRGMGPDAHTASLFPGEPLIANRTDIAASVWVEKFRQHRVTLLPGVLEKASRTYCLVTGTDKAEALDNVMRGPRDPLQFPSQISSDVMTWYIDTAAGANL